LAESGLINGLAQKKLGDIVFRGLGLAGLVRLRLFLDGKFPGLVLARMQEGWSYEAIAEAEKLSRERIRRIVKEAQAPVGAAGEGEAGWGHGGVRAEEGRIA